MEHSHLTAAMDALNDAKDGLLEAGTDRAGLLYAQIAIGHALIQLAADLQGGVVRVAETLDRIQDDLHAMDARLKQMSGD